MTTATEELVDHQDVPEAPQEPDAPWGYKPNGEPYKVDPAMYAKRQNNGGRRRKPTMTGASSPPKRTTPNTRKAPAGPDHAKALHGFVQMLAGGLVMAGRALKSKAIMADGCAAIVHGPPLVEAVADIALENRQFAAILDKVSVVGPYSAVIGAAVPFVLQVLVNHRGGKPPTQMAEAFGVMSADALIEKVSGIPGAPANDD